MNMNTSKSDHNEAFAETKEALVIDDFEEDEILNSLNQKTNIYVKAPSKAMISHSPITREGKAGTGLLLKFEKANEGGPYGMGGWCGYYTLLKNEKEGTYFDGSEYKYLGFWLRGETGSENFTIGLSDRHWDKIGDSLKSQEIVTYIPDGKVSTEWEYVRVPLKEFFLDYSQLAAITINFEGSCFPEGKGEGIIYVDDLMLER